MKQTLDIINSACEAHGPGYLAFSGGTDSTVLVDLVYRLPPLGFRLHRDATAEELRPMTSKRTSTIAESHTHE